MTVGVEHDLRAQRHSLAHRWMLVLAGGYLGGTVAFSFDLCTKRKRTRRPLIMLPSDGKMYAARMFDTFPKAKTMQAACRNRRRLDQSMSTKPRPDKKLS